MSVFILTFSYRQYYQTYNVYTALTNTSNCDQTGPLKYRVGQTDGMMCSAAEANSVLALFGASILLLNHQAGAYVATLIRILIM